MKNEINVHNTIISKAHIDAVNRRRQIFCQYDQSSYQTPELLGSDIEKMILYWFGYIDQAESQVDTMCLDVSNEGVACYPSDILPLQQDPGLKKWWDQGIDYIEHMVNACHERGKEMFWNHRMNEIERGHGGFRIGSGREMNTMNPVKAEHPEWLIKSWWWQGNWNLAIEGARRYKHDILKELAYKYDFDGIQLDFARHIPHLPPGRQWELRDSITEFVASVRSMLLKHAIDRGRPFLLAVRIPENLKGCHIDGIDVEQWVDRDLVDILVLGTRTMNVDVQAFREIVGNKNIKIIPSFDGWHTTDAYCIQTIEFLRGVYGNWWCQGADSVGTFNWDCAPPDMAREIGAIEGPAPQELANSEIGDLETIVGKPRIYALDRRGGYLSHVNMEGYFGRNDNSQLPVKLLNHGAVEELTINIWEQIPNEDKITLRIILFNFLPNDNISVQLNGVLLENELRDTEWKDRQIFSPKPQPVTMGPYSYLESVEDQTLTKIDFLLTNTIVRKGKNTISISVRNRGEYEIGQDIKVEKVELYIV